MGFDRLPVAWCTKGLWSRARSQSILMEAGQIVSHTPRRNGNQCNACTFSGGNHFNRLRRQDGIWWLSSSSALSSLSLFYHFQNTSCAFHPPDSCLSCFAASRKFQIAFTVVGRCRRRIHAATTDGFQIQTSRGGSIKCCTQRHLGLFSNIQSTNPTSGRQSVEYLTFFIHHHLHDRSGSRSGGIPKYRRGQTSNKIRHQT
mmetsp:Transcript_54497/g.157584  ORF Transcript_54497/g.157584 Transcript_54497/m.157584 type:complete len:201 (+) Transcript_54497:3747-4349(+)